MLPKYRFAFILLLAICTLGLDVAPPGVSPAVAAPEDVALFQDALSTYGQWLNHGQYGSVWRPGQVNRTWRPYSNGRWIPSQEGYVFETDEPWGWATYHYGNWMPTNEHGWVWVPGRTWYPHTVNWRTSDENVGWAPVPPPEYTGSDNYYSGDYADGGYGYAPGSNSSGYSLNPLSWIFTGVQDFLLGWGQPYSSAYSYANAGVLTSPQYIPTIYERTVYVNNYVSPSYAPNAYYNWGPPVPYLTRVTNIKNIDFERRCRDIRLDRLRNVVPPANLRHRHPAWREVWPAAAANREIRVRPVAHHKIAASRLNRPDALPAPSSLPRRRVEVSPAHGPTGRPLPPEAAGSRPFAAGILPVPDNRNALRQPLPAPSPPSRYQTQRGRQPIDAAAAQENQLRRPQAEKLQQDRRNAEQALRLRQQPRLELERRQQEARARQIPPAPPQVRSQPQLPVEQQPRRAEMLRQQQLQQQRQAEMLRQQQAQQQRQAEMQRQQQMMQQQRQAEMQRQQQMQQQRQAEMQRQQQMQQQRQAEMMRARQMQQQQMARQSSPPPPPPQAPPPRQKKQDNNQK